MTPEQQKLIDAAAEALYEADRAVRAKGGWRWPEWADAFGDTKDRYRARVTIPVTVALRAAVEVCKDDLPSPSDPTRNFNDYTKGYNDCAGHISVTISSLIPQETQNDQG